MEWRNKVKRKVLALPLDDLAFCVRQMHDAVSEVDVTGQRTIQPPTIRART